MNKDFLAENIKSFRLMKKLSQGELAQLLNVSPQAVSKWENRHCYPDIVLLPEIASILGTTIDKLMTEKTEAG